MRKNSRAKGKRGELEAAQKIREVFGAECHRAQQFCGRAGDSDIKLTGLHVEVKRTEKFALYEAVDQVLSDNVAGDPWVIMHRRNRREWVMVLTPENLLAVADVLRKGMADGPEPV